MLKTMRSIDSFSTSMDSMDEDERQEILISESERIYLELLEKCKVDPNFKTRVQKLRLLCKENSEIRLRLNYANILQNMHDTYDEIFALYDEQSAMMLNILTGSLDCPVDLSHTCLESVAVIALTTKTLLDSWLRIGPAIIHNKWFFDCLPVKMQEFRQKSHNLLNMAVPITKLLTTVVHVGFKILIRLTPNQIPERFLNDFVHGLNDFNLMLKKVTLLINDAGLCSSFPELPQPYKLDDILTQMSDLDGEYLANFVIGQIEELSPLGEDFEIPPDEEYMKDMELFIQLELSEILPPLTEEEYDKTSDYCSSTGSLSCTSPTGKPNVPRLPPVLQNNPKPYVQLRKKLQNIYTTFLEHKYSVFLALIESASNYKGLNVGTGPKNKRRRVVSWLDDCLRHQRRQLWKQYVQNLWDSYQHQLVANFRVGRRSALSMLLCHSVFSKHLITVVHEALSAVPLPDNLVAPEKAQVLLAHDLEQRVSATIIDDCVIAARRENGQLMITGNAKPVTKTWKSLRKYATVTTICKKPIETTKQPLTLSTSNGRKADQSARQLGYWSLATAEVRFLASYNIQGFLLNQLCEMSTARQLKCNLMPKAQRSESIRQLRSKVVAYTLDQMENICPSKTHWSANKGADSESSEYMKVLCDTVLEPFNNSVPLLSATHRKEVTTTVIGAFIQAFINYFFTHKIKLSNKGMQRLVQDLSVAEHWLQENPVFGGEKVDIFDRVRAQMNGLERRQSQLTVVFHANNRVDPEPVRRKRSSQPTCEIEVPTTAQWQSLKTNRFNPAQCCMCL